ncbi:MAG: PAS domain S-box protein, partial [Calditrichaeota bacterium]|nr:PAS domain S-box protein [Calditrichota bacterium]
EIYVDNWSPGNGTRINGTDDFHSYFIVLNLKGELLYRETIASENGTMINLFYSDKNTNLLLYTAVHTANLNFYEEDKLIKWDLLGENQYVKEHTNTEFQFKDLRGVALLLYRGIPHIFAVDGNERLALFDSVLTFKKVFPVKQKLSVYLGSFDLNQDGKKEHLWSTPGDTAIILDESFKPIASIPNVRKVLRVQRGRLEPANYAIMTTKKELYEIALRRVSVFRQLRTNLFSNHVIVFLILGFIVILLSSYYFQPFTWLKNRIFYFNDSLSAIMVLNRKGQIAAFNKRLEQLISQEEQTITGKMLKDVIAPGSYFNSLSDWINRQLKNKKNGQARLKLQSNGNEQILNVSLELLYNSFKRFMGALVIINDVTPNIQAQKTASWITIAQKLAHEIKNPLTTIRLSLQRLKMEYESDPQEKKRFSGLVEGSLKESNRIRRVVDDFLRFSQIESRQPKSLQLDQVLAEFLQRYSLNLPSGIEIRKEIQPDLPFIKADPTQMLNLFTNLIDNAAQAIEPPGMITIKINYIEKIHAAPLERIDNFIQIEVSDTGVGMTEEHQQKIFNPFYSTKEGGSGLGLAIVKKIVEDHNGQIEVFSRKNLGTHITVLLPIHNE